MAAINSGDEAAAWAHRNLPAKNTLTAADAKMVEERFRARLSAIGPSYGDGWQMLGSPPVRFRPEPFRDATAWLRMQSDANPSPNPNFPDNREINREFYKIWASAAIFITNRPENSMAYSKIPYSTEQGIFERLSGKICQVTGNMHCGIVVSKRRTESGISTV
jgi:hypothetical protein